MRGVRAGLFVVLALLITSIRAVAQGAGPCSRFVAGSTVSNPPALFSQNGTLTVSLSYNTAQDPEGRQLYCFTTPDGTESPTLHVRPGDHLVVHVKNNLPKPTMASAMQMSTNAATVCGATTMNASSVNIHYHGTNTSPTCHQDEVIHTIINSGETFTYNVAFPRDEPPGLYWYHPHIHGIAEPAVLGGASGALIVDGIEDIQPAVAGMSQRVLVIRDQNVAGQPMPGGAVPSWDLTLNYVPISYPALVPAVIKMEPGEQQFWRVANACADTILDLQVTYDGKPQTIKLVALDGVPVGSQDGTQRGKLIPVTDIRLPPASRVEFILTGPSQKVKSAQFLTQAINTGRDGDNDTQRTLANIQPVGDRMGGDAMVNAYPSAPWRQRFEGLATAAVTARRELYFSENADQTKFFITVDGQTPTVFSPTNPPAVVTTQGSVEDWEVENRAQENHEFHFHQIHFMVLSQDNFQVNGSQPVRALQGQLMDMIEIPYWDGNPAHPYPKVTVRMDFRGPDIGDFVYHCHILNHEDQGMMAIIRVLPGTGAKIKRLKVHGRNTDLSRRGVSKVVKVASNQGD
ncbi:MAG TPA: multicopper oxidase domain-containing protein [Candidatus Binataceae bacterium]|jgi:FtsP/CotA-like multicopper oxidase with cupredoxin domain|nr:multicopper oxidase domain-containing protein [Candidatus Binataceae bacterium]